jgi:Putative Actinobacterial Holin-X, holin superfamily III
VALNHRDQPPLDAPAAGPRDGRNGASAVHDPAHVGGPLPDATFPELIGRLINDVSDLADRQIELAKQEIAEAKDEVIGAVKRIAIGAGIAVACALLLVIWAWTAFIWFFNWLGAFVQIGPVTLAWIGWLLGLVVPAAAAFFAYRSFIRPGISRATGVWPPLPRTRSTLKEDLEWVRDLRTRSAR